LCLSVLQMGFGEVPLASCNQSSPKSALLLRSLRHQGTMRQKGGGEAGNEQWAAYIDQDGRSYYYNAITGMFDRLSDLCCLGWVLSDPHGKSKAGGANGSCLPLNHTGVSQYENPYAYSDDSDEEELENGSIETPDPASTPEQVGRLYTCTRACALWPFRVFLTRHVLRESSNWVRRGSAMRASCLCRCPPPGSSSPTCPLGPPIGTTRSPGRHAGRTRPRRGGSWWLWAWTRPGR
jgi:hypothetical protein